MPSRLINLAFNVKSRAPDGNMLSFTLGSCQLYIVYQSFFGVLKKTVSSHKTGERGTLWHVEWRHKIIKTNAGPGERS